MLAFVFKCAVIALCVYLTLALVLVFTQFPTDAPGESLDFSRQSGEAVSTSELLSYTARDGTKLNYRQFGKAGAPLIIIIHGSSAHGGLYEQLSVGLSELGTIITPDLRGHAGLTPAGDVSYIGQLEDDLADLIASTRVQNNQPVILVGHSSGGGLAVRYAGNADHDQPDGVVLLAPYLGYNSPTMKTESGGWAQTLTRRIIGLSMLNGVGVRLLNHLQVISFRVPENAEALKMTESYSFRMNTSFAPRRDFKKDMAALPRFKILIGQQDEAFTASEFEPLLKSFDNNGSVEVLEGLSHLDIIGSAIAHKKIHEFVIGLSSN